MRGTPGIALIALAAGCGGAEPTLEIRFAAQALLDRAAVVAVYFFASPSTCAELRAGPRPTSTVGPFNARLDDAARASGIKFRVDDLPVGSYVVVADAHADGGALVGTGCAEGQKVLDRELTKIRILIRDP